MNFDLRGLYLMKRVFQQQSRDLALVLDLVARPLQDRHLRRCQTPPQKYR